MSYAPIVIFGFDRPLHLENMIKSLSANVEAQESEAHIFIDGPTNKVDMDNYKKVIEIVNGELPFKKSHVTVREKNLQCKNNIIFGVTEVIQKTGKAIIMEDDLVVSNQFLHFMNSSLEKYDNNNNIWHINGYSFPQLLGSEKKTSISKLAQPWGWATWVENWNIFVSEDNQYYKKNIISTLSKQQREEYNFYNLASYWEEALKLDGKNKNSIWDAYWYQTIYLNKGFTIFPQVSHVQNFGFDGTGLHCGVNKEFDTRLNTQQTTIFPNKIKESLIYKANVYFFHKKRNMKNYFNFHKEKFSSISNLKKWISKKL